MFELAPMAMFLRDLSALKRLFEAWRARGVTDLRAHLWDAPELVAECIRGCRMIKANRAALRLLGGSDTASMMALVLHTVRNVDHRSYIERFARLWDGEQDYVVRTRIATAAGTWRDVVLHCKFLPGHGCDWHRGLIAVEEVNGQDETLRQLLQSEHYARDLFDLSPVSLWVEDFTAIKRLLDGLRRGGVDDLRAYAARHPDFALCCMKSIRLIDVNRQTLTMFEAPDKAALLEGMQDVLPETLAPQFVEQIAALWDGALQYRGEVINYTLAGRPLNLLLQLSIMPDHARDWSRVLVALTDITARKQAEARLEFLGRHDALTGLANRSAYLEEIRRLEGSGPFPVSVFMIDLDGLKAVNDQAGHAAGDELLRRAGLILRRAGEQPCCAARLGGDEFALIMPGADEAAAAAAAERLEALLRRDNELAEPLLRLSIGFATCWSAGCIEATIRQADLAMYEVKRAAYAALPRDFGRRLN